MAYRLESEATSLNDSALDAVTSQYRRIVELRPEEPQSHRDLALILVRKANLMMMKSKSNNTLVAEEQSLRNQARQLYTEALNLFVKVVMGKWDCRFDQVQLTTVTDLNRVLAIVKHHDMADLEVHLREEVLFHLERNLTLLVLESGRQKISFSFRTRPSCCCKVGHRYDER